MLEEVKRLKNDAVNNKFRDILTRLSDGIALLEDYQFLM